MEEHSRWHARGHGFESRREQKVAVRDKKIMDSVAHTTDEQIWLRKPPGEILSGRMVPG